MSYPPKSIPQYIKYIRMLLQKSKYDGYIEKICSSIEKNNYTMSPRQFDILERYRKGDNVSYSTKNENMNAKSKLVHLIKEIIKMKFKSGPSGGRRFIPPTIEVPLSNIEKLNNEKGGPHIKRITKGNEIILLISTYLRIALEESKRGRTTRQGEIDKNQLLKRFDEIFSKSPLFKGALKKSIQGSKQLNTSSGIFVPSNLEISTEDQKDPKILIIKNPTNFKSEV